MVDFVYSVCMNKFGVYEIEKHEVFNRTEKTVTVKMDWDSKPCRYFLDSVDRSFFDTMEKAVAEATEKITDRLKYHEEWIKRLTDRFQELCEHKAITGPSDGRCVRCNFKVPNPDDYCNGG